MGEVYIAQDTALRRRVAFKLLPQATVNDEQARKRMLREARAAATLDHQNICTIYEVGETEGNIFIAMQLIEGETLAQRLGKGLFAWREALPIAVQIADALTAAHLHGIIHRDIKPSNIMLRPDGQIKVLDFGLARVMRSSKDVLSHAETEMLLTKSDAVAGTIPYMSPEQLRGGAVNARMDVFSFGVVLYEMLTGKLPFVRASTAETISAILTESPPPTSTYAPGVPRELDRIVDKCVEKNIEGRYQKMSDVASDLRALQNALDESILSAAPTVVNFPVTRKFPLKIGVVTAAAILLLTLIGIGLYRRLVNRPAQNIASLAVLPLANVGGDPNLDYLSDGLTESLIDRLSQLPDLRVVSRSAVFRYKGTSVDPQQAAHALNVEVVLTGQIVHRGDALSIKMELVSASDNSHLWGNDYERKLTDALMVQQEIVREVSGRLRPSLASNMQTLDRRSTQNPAAYQLYLRGRYFWNKRTEEGLRKSIEYYEQAAKLDPGYALAYVGIADSYGMTTATMDTFPPVEAASKAKEAALRALGIDGGLAEAHVALARVKMSFDWDWAAAEREFQRAIELNPSYGEAHHTYAHYLMARKRVPEAFNESQKYLEFDPLNLGASNHLSWHYLYARRYDEALAQTNKTAEMDPNFLGMLLYRGWIYEQKRMYPEAIAELQKAVQISPTPLMLASLGHAYGLGGKKAEAEKILADLDRLSQRRYVPAYDRAIVYIGLKERDQALTWLERAAQEHSQFVIYLDTDPRLDDLRSEQRFQKLLRLMGFL